MASYIVGLRGSMPTYIFVFYLDDFLLPESQIFSAYSCSKKDIEKVFGAVRVVLISWNIQLDLFLYGITVLMEPRLVCSMGDYWMPTTHFYSHSVSRYLLHCYRVCWLYNFWGYWKRWLYGSKLETQHVDFYSYFAWHALGVALNGAVGWKQNLWVLIVVILKYPVCLSNTAQSCHCQQISAEGFSWQKGRTNRLFLGTAGDKEIRRYCRLGLGSQVVLLGFFPVFAYLFICSNAIIPSINSGYFVCCVLKILLLADRKDASECVMKKDVINLSSSWKIVLMSQLDDS